MLFTPGIGPMDILFMLTMLGFGIIYIIGWFRGRKAGYSDGYLAGLRKGQKKLRASGARRY